MKTSLKLTPGKRTGIITAALLFLTAACFAIAADLTGKWTGNINIPNGPSVPLSYNFKVDGEKLTGSMEGPDGTVDIEDGKIKGQDFSFKIVGKSGDLLQTGKYFGDSTTIDFTARSMNFHIKLHRVQ